MFCLYTVDIKKMGVEGILQSIVSNTYAYWACVVVFTIAAIALYIVYAIKTYESKDGKEFMEQSGVWFRIISAGLLGALFAFEMLMRVKARMSQVLDKVYIHEIHQMVATDGNRVYDKSKVAAYRELMSERKGKKFVSSKPLQENDALITELGIMKISPKDMDIMEGDETNTYTNNPLLNPLGY